MRLLASIFAFLALAASALAGSVQTSFDPTRNDDSTRGFVYGDTWDNTATTNQFEYVGGSTPGTAIWRHVPRVIAAGGAAITAPANDTNENILVTIALPGHTMGANGMLELDTVWTVTNNANNKLLKFRMGGIGGTDFYANTLASVATQQHKLMVMNRGSESSQVAFTAAQSVFSTSANANFTGTVATGSDLTLLITATKATGSDTVTLERYILRLSRPDIQ